MARVIAYAKANAGKLYHASPGNGTSPHMSMEMFKLMAHVVLNNITYRGMNDPIPPVLNPCCNQQRS